MASSDERSRGFFGSGAWGRKVFWSNVPTQHQNLDTDGYLEALLKTWGDESESLLQQMLELPFQREPLAVRGRDAEAEWFYFTDSFLYEDEYWGTVFRLVGEKQFSEMPNTDEADVPTMNADDIAQWFGWWPYEPISKVARWWNATIPSFDNAGRGTAPGREASWENVPCKVVQVRTRSYDQPEIYNEEFSQGNEVWVQAGDLNLFFDYLSDNVRWRNDWSRIAEGKGTAQPPAELPYAPARLRTNETSLTPIAAISIINQANPCQITFATAHGLTTGDYIRIDDVAGMTELNLNVYQVTVVGPAAVTLNGVDSTSYGAYNSGGNAYLPWTAGDSQLRLQMELFTGGRAGIYDAPDKFVVKIADATQAKPCVIETVKEHNMSTGDRVSMQNIRGMVELNGQEFEVYVDDKTHFRLKGSDSRGYGAYTAGGEVTYTGSLREESGNLYPEIPLAANSGVMVTIQLNEGVASVVDTSSPFTADMVGKTLTLDGFLWPANNGVFTVNKFVDSNTIEYANSGAQVTGISSNHSWSIGSGVLDTSVSYGTIVYQTGEMVVDLTLVGDTVVADSDILAKWYARGYYIPFYPQPLIDYLAKDFGFLNDRNDPEDVQRSTIANLTKYFGLKASADSYRIRGEISLFRVTAKALFALGPSNEELWANLPTDRAFNYGGSLYTDIASRRVRYDDICGDELFFDPDFWSWMTIVDNDIMYIDGSPDGYSPGLAFGLDVAQGFYAPVAPDPDASTGFSSVINVAGSTFTISGNHTVQLASVSKVGISGSSGNDGAYDVVSVALNGGNTDVQVSGGIPDLIPDGKMTWIVTTRDPAGIVSSVQLPSTEAATLGLVAGYRVSIEMMRKQYETFNFLKGAFGVTHYIRAGNDANPNGIPPALEDFVYWIDSVDVPWTLTEAGSTTDQDIGVWTVLIGVGIDADGNTLPGPGVGHAPITGVNTGTKTFTIAGDYTGVIGPTSKIEVVRSTGNNGVYSVDAVFLSGCNTDILCNEVVPDGTVDGTLCWEDAAIRYYPDVVFADCDFCRTYKMRVEIEPTDEAYDFYGDETDLSLAIKRLRRKISPARTSAVLQGSSIVPLHVRVADWAITRSIILEDVITATATSTETNIFISDLLGTPVAVYLRSKELVMQGNLLKEIENFSGLTYNGVNYDIVGVEYYPECDLTVIEVDSYPPSSLYEVYLLPNRIKMKVEQRGTMGSGQQQTVEVRDSSGVLVWSASGGSGIDDDDNWSVLAEDVFLDGSVVSAEDIRNDSPVSLSAFVSSGTITSGEVRFTFEISKYEE